MRKIGQSREEVCECGCGRNFYDVVNEHIFDIAKVGLTVITEFIGETTIHYSLGYSHPKLGLPELVVMGIPSYPDMTAFEAACQVFKTIQQNYIRKGMIPEDGDVLDNILEHPGYRPIAKAVPYREGFWNSCFEIGVEVCRRVQLPTNFEVLQIVAPDKDHRYPWDIGYSMSQHQFLLADAEIPAVQP